MEGLGEEKDGDEDEKENEEEDEELEEDMTNLSGRGEHTSPVCIDFESRSKRAGVRNSGGQLIMAFEEAERRSVILISTVESPSIQWFTTNDAKKPKSSLRVTSYVRCCQRHVSTREAQPS